ncbi:MAG: hypothetical protein IPJ84_12455 [Bdellovibrionales bacterium]|nr:hypothetical protein [Bdellovibrionales bacterium]
MIRNTPLILIALIVTIAGCASSPTENSQRVAASPLEAERVETIAVPADHAQAIEKSSSGDSEFSGLYNTFELKATMLNSTVRESILKRQSEYYLWEPSQLANEREKATQELSSETGVFLSFSTPERKNDNLADSKTIWRIYLEAGGRRYVGKAKRDRRLIAELQSLFPYHTRWNSPYTITFPVAASALEGQAIRLTVTGPLGTRVLEFH